MHACPPGLASRYRASRCHARPGTTTRVMPGPSGVRRHWQAGSAHRGSRLGRLGYRCDAGRQAAAVAVSSRKTPSALLTRRCGDHVDRPGAGHLVAGRGGVAVGPGSCHAYCMLACFTRCRPRVLPCRVSDRPVADRRPRAPRLAAEAVPRAGRTATLAPLCFSFHTARSVDARVNAPCFCFGALARAVFRRHLE